MKRRNFIKTIGLFPFISLNVEPKPKTIPEFEHIKYGKTTFEQLALKHEKDIKNNP